MNGIQIDVLIQICDVLLASDLYSANSIGLEPSTVANVLHDLADKAYELLLEDEYLSSLPQLSNFAQRDSSAMKTVRLPNPYLSRFHFMRTRGLGSKLVMRSLAAGRSFRGFS